MERSNFATGEFVECEKAKEMANVLSQIKDEYKRATEADGKLYFYCRGNALFDLSSLIQPYEDFDYRLCENRDCKGNSCFDKLKKDWEVFVDEVGKGKFTHSSPIAVVSAAILNEERTIKRKKALESAIEDALFNLNRKESIEHDMAIIGKILSMINKNAEFKSEIFVTRFKNRLQDNYGIEHDAYDLVNVYNKLAEFYKR